MITVYVDPWNPELELDGLFDMAPRMVNRDGVLTCWGYLRDSCKAVGIHLHTADMMPQEGTSDGPFLCYNFGSLDGYLKYRLRRDIILGSIYLFEPPIGLVASRDLYLYLPELCRAYRRVYTTSPIEEINKCYGRDISNDRTLEFCYPQNHNKIIEPLWSNQNRKLLVMVNSYNYSPLRNREYYSERIRALGYFGRYGVIDLYGYRWNKITGNALGYLLRVAFDFYRRRSLARTREVPVVLKCQQAIKKVWLGPCVNAMYETLAQYEFSICFESMGIKGFLSEKLFDCLMVGTIPIYLGTPDVTERIPEDCFIDHRQFDSYADLHRYIIAMSPNEKQRRREAGREFFESEKFRPYSMAFFAERIITDVNSDIMNLSKGLVNSMLL
jgi:hypothetical protein